MTSTTQNVHDDSPRTALWIRHIATALLALFLLAGVVGLLGDRVQTGSASEDGYSLELEYPRTARPGMDVPWLLTITNEAGLPAEVEVRVTSDYFSIFEHQGISPAPSAETSDDTYTYWTFDAPEGTTLTVEIDHYVQPVAQIGASGTVAVIVEGRPVAEIAFTTTLFP